MPAPASLLLPLDQLPDPLPIEPLTKPFDVTIRPPGSKSITNRALLLAALAEGTSTLRGALVDADDAQVMIRALEQLGAKIEVCGASGVSPGSNDLRVTGVAGRWKIAPGMTVHLDLHNAGTATRFLTAAAILAPPDSGGIVIDGDARMRERPIGELTTALVRLGASAAFLATPGFPPVRVKPPTNLDSLAPQLEFDRTASSQFISAVLLVAPFLPHGLDVLLRPPITSESYVNMTVRLLGEALATCACDRNTVDPGSPRRIRVEPERNSESGTAPLLAFEFAVEPDASGATYFWAAAAMHAEASCTVPGLNRNSMQEDAETFLDALDDAGANVGCVYGNGASSGDACAVRGRGSLRPLTLDCADIPDAAMTLAVLACFASSSPDNPTATSTLGGLRTLRVKETDRLAALETELSKIGATVKIFKDGDDEGLRITPPSPLSLTREAPKVIFETYNDHRMAMALALIGLRRPNVFIRNPACVRKTYPGYWKDLARLYQ